MKKQRLKIEDRLLIQELLKMNYNLKSIARAIDSHSSTISREIKKRKVPNDKTEPCIKIERFPFVCNGCGKKNYCRKRKYYYNYSEADRQYKANLKSSRIGIDMSIDEVEYWNDFFRDKLKNKNQPILHIFKNIEHSFPRSIQTFYKYVHRGYFPSINNEVLARSFSYKPRKKPEDKIQPIHKDNAIKRGRRYKDFETYLKKNPKANIVEMDTVIGKAEDKYCILTLYFRNTKLMLMFFIKKYKPDEVTTVFNTIRKSIGDENYKKLFEVILTDNGWEFSKPLDIEVSHLTGEKLINIFYCEPFSSWQKPGVERNHEFIRYIIPKGISFDYLNKKNIIDIMNNINNVQRKSLDYHTPYSLFYNLYGGDISKSLQLIPINKDEVDLSYSILNK